MQLLAPSCWLEKDAEVGVPMPDFGISFGITKDGEPLRGVCDYSDWTGHGIVPALQRNGSPILLSSRR